MSAAIHPDALNALVAGDMGAPAMLLGRQRSGDSVIMRTFRPWAARIDLVCSETGERVAMQKRHAAGLFAVELDAAWSQRTYHYECVTQENQRERYGDPYIYPPLLSDYDRHLFGQGAHREIYERLGAHLRCIDGVPGVNFAVWAPNCYKVAVVGDFNRWDGRTHILQAKGASGIWELFVPGIGAGERYKFEVRSHNRGYQAQKADPFAFQAELRPKTASIVCDIDDYTWGDADWLAARAQADPLRQPLNIYEAHLGSWRRGDGNRFLSYRELARELVPYLVDMGYTHLE
ncbi:MAG: 1,4-alpha-glucan branching enzyme, partial [Chloroflexi bacterium]|nr:1,4-alpha-glucan branching enzyme [Chloroflexota bacterium]